MPSPFPKQVSDQLKGAEAGLARANALVGLDGFVDTILHVVDKRESATKFTRLGKMGEFGKRIQAAAGLSANIELVTEMVKLGGNGPIMANALRSAGLPVTYVGNLGTPNIHPIFAEFARRAEVHSIAEPGFTDAIEFNDGKLMFGKHESLKNISWEKIADHLPEEKLLSIFASSSLIALVNWTMLPHMTSIFQKILSRIAPKLTGEKRWLFLDLCDPAKRTRGDIEKLLATIAKFQKHFRAVLGLNLQESRQIGEALGIKAPRDSHAEVTAHAARIREKLNIETVVIHPTSFAAAADTNGTACVEGPFTSKPRITTGAGDHFNAGFCVGRLLGGDLAMSLQCGVATSGFYVRNAKSPTVADLRKFLRTL